MSPPVQALLKQNRKLTTKVHCGIPLSIGNRYALSFQFKKSYARNGYF